MSGIRIFVAMFLCTALLSAQEQNSGGAHDHTDMHDMQSMSSHDTGSDHALATEITQHTASGTSIEPASVVPPMYMFSARDWHFMLHGELFLNDTQQTGPRGRDKFFSTNWIMPMAQRKLGGAGTLTIRAMLSLEPATVTGRYYPELFQYGETAFGHAIIDGQHPHDFIMELAALYDQPLSEHTLLSFYAAPMGDPALGPAAYPHRASASEDPVAPLAHHLQDSTHIAANVFTTGLAYKQVRVEASGFHGREPDEFRWDLNGGRIDSWSSRLTFNPGVNWSAQYSYARLASPEVLHPDEDIERMTASVMYNRPLSSGRWSSSLVWGRNRTLQNGAIGNGFTAESTLQFGHSNYAWTRIENVDRTSDLLGDSNVADEHFIGRVQAYTFGFAHDFHLVPQIATAVGAQLTTYGVPDTLRTAYGAHPLGATVFLRLRPAEHSH
jgi:hypothetical protein